MVSPRAPTRGQRVQCEFLDITMHWYSAADTYIRATYVGSGMSRDCFVWHGCAQAGEPQGYAFKLATGSRGEAKSVREAASAAGLGDVVPTVFGAFVVDIGDGVPGLTFIHRRVHCFVTLAMEETVSDQVAAWKRVPLTPRLVNDAIAMVCAIIDFMIYAAGARRLGLGGWRVAVSYTHLTLPTTPYV